MSFDKKVAENALVSCGRHCCLCHKFCGTKMELHHIKQKRDGGEDTFDNCLPLCFDCHADVGQYNPKHPKGKRYTISELKAHRNIWYQKVKASEGLFVSDSNYLKLDRKTFERFNHLLDNKIMYFIKTNSFVLGSFSDDVYRYVYMFINECELPEFEFIDSDIECLKVKLYSDFKSLSKLISKYTYGAGPERQAIPYEWEQSDTIRLDEAITKFEEITLIITNTYESLIKLARRKLFAD